MVIQIQNIRLEPPYIVTKPGVTEEEYLALANGTTNTELIDGEMIIFSPVKKGQEQLPRMLLMSLSLYVRRDDLGQILGSRVPMRLKPDTLPEPDILFVSKERLHLIKEQFVDGPADLVMEVMREGTRRHDLQRKRPLYQEHRVRECWFIDPPKREILVDLFDGNSYRTQTVQTGPVESAVIPDFCLQAEWLWQDPLPDALTLLEDVLSRQYYVIRVGSSHPPLA